MSDQSASQLLRSLLQRRAGAAAPTAWKVALNVAAVRQRLGLTEALAVPLEALHEYPSGTAIPVAGARQLHVEAELALRLDRDLDQLPDLETLRASVSTYTPCLELVDYAHPRTSLSQMFEHRFFHAGVVLGASFSRDGFSALPVVYPSAIDAAGCAHARVPGNVPDDVVEALRGALLRVLEAGGVLRRGQLLLCGSYIEPVPLPDGARVRVDYGALGSLEIAASK
jgi:2-keto-4-pentenoate hydratase